MTVSNNYSYFASAAEKQHDNDGTLSASFKDAMANDHFVFSWH